MKIKICLTTIIFMLSFNTQTFTNITKDKPNIIIIHGCSSSGKSSTAKALQNLYATDNKPFFYLPMDDILCMLPKKWVNPNPRDEKNQVTVSDGLQFIKQIDPHSSQPTIKILIGQTIVNASYGMIKMVDALASAHNNVIFEGIFPAWLFEDIEKLRKTHTVYIIAITCDLAIMEQREIQRNNGLIGITRSQHGNPEYWSYNNYDLIVDTSNICPQEAAQLIKNFIDQSKG